MRHNIKAFTLVEMLVALAVSSIIVAATYASFELIQKQYKKNIDVAELHTSGRAIMTILEREVRMAGYEFRDGNGLMTYGPIVGPLIITDSGDKCCDEVTIIYDEVFDTLNASGVVTSSSVERVKTRFWTEPYSTSKRGNRHRLYKRRTILGTGNALLATPRVGAKEIMADYIDDLQLNFVINAKLFAGFNGSKSINIIDPSTKAVNTSISNTSQAHALAFDSSGQLYAGFNGSNSIKTINTISNSVTGTIPSTSQAHALAFDSSGNLYVGYNGASNITIINPTTKAVVSNITNTSNVSALASNNSGLLYAGFNGTNSIKIINTTTKTATGTIPNTSQASALAVDNAGNLYVGFNGTKPINIINPSTKAVTGTIPNTSQASALAFDSSGLLYAGFNGSNSIKIINPSTKAVTGTIPNTSQASAVVFQTKKLGNGSTISINLTLRTTGQYGKDRQFLKKDYFYGNFNMNKKDKYIRDTFSTTVSVRNL